MSANFDHLLNASDKLAESIRSTARASQIVIDTSSKEGLSKEVAEQNLNKALDELSASQERLDETTAILDSVDWSKIPVQIAPDREFIYQTTAILQKDAQELIDAINSALGKSTD